MHLDTGADPQGMSGGPWHTLWSSHGLLNMDYISLDRDICNKDY